MPQVFSPSFLKKLFLRVLLNEFNEYTCYSLYLLHCHNTKLISPVVWLLPGHHTYCMCVVATEALSKHQVTQTITIPTAKNVDRPRSIQCWILSVSCALPNVPEAVQFGSYMSRWQQLVAPYLGEEKKKFLKENQGIWLEGDLKLLCWSLLLLAQKLMHWSYWTETAVATIAPSKHRWAYS